MRIALLSCTKSKAPCPAPARDLYAPSALFRKALAYVEPQVDLVYVLSAKYGLVTLDQPLEPYELTLKTMPAEQQAAWASQVLGQIQVRHGTNLTGFTFEFHTGVEYRKHLERHLRRAGATCTCPVEGLPIGDRLHYYGIDGAQTEPAPVAGAGELSGETAIRPSSGSFAEIWMRIASHAGERFHQVRGGAFSYVVTGDYLRFDRTAQPLPRKHLEEAYGLVPLRSTAEVQHLRAPSYIYAILMDPRIRQSDW